MVNNSPERKVVDSPGTEKTQPPNKIDDLKTEIAFMENIEGLEIQLHDSSWVKFTNNDTDGEAAQRHSFVGTLSDRLVLVRTQHYEGGSYTILNISSGTQIVTPTLPYISPDKKWIAEVGYENEEESVKPGFRIWETTQESFQLSLNLSGANARGIFWISSSEIDVCLKNSPLLECEPHRFVLKKGTWVAQTNHRDSSERQSLFKPVIDIDIDWDYAEAELAKQFKSWASRDITYNEGVLYGFEQSGLIGYNLESGEKLTFQLPIQFDRSLSIAAMGNYLWVDQLLIDLQSKTVNPITVEEYLPSPYIGEVTWDDNQIWITSGKPGVGKQGKEISSVDCSVFDRKSGRYIRDFNINAAYSKLILGPQSLIFLGGRKIRQFDRQNGAELFNIVIPKKWIFDVTSSKDGFYFLTGDSITLISDNGTVLAQIESPKLKYPERILVNIWNDIIVMGDRALYQLNGEEWKLIYDITQDSRAIEVKDLELADDKRYMWVLTRNGITGINLE